MGTVKTERRMVVGGLSVLMIFLTMSIAIYGLLSLMTAENELSLNLRNREAATAFYSADAKAAAVISEIASARIRGGNVDSDIATLSVTYDSDTDSAKFIVPIDRYRDLDVIISFSADGSLFVIDSYRVVNNIDWHQQAESGLTVITEFN